MGSGWGGDVWEIFFLYRDEFGMEEVVQGSKTGSVLGVYFWSL